MTFDFLPIAHLFVDQPRQIDEKHIKFVPVS